MPWSRGSHNIRYLLYQAAVRKTPHVLSIQIALFPSQIACVMPEIPKIFPPIGASIYASAEGRDEDEERARFSPTTREREQTACSCRFRMIHSPSPLKKSESRGVRRFTEIYRRNFRSRNLCRASRDSGGTRISLAITANASISSREILVARNPNINDFGAHFHPPFVIGF